MKQIERICEKHGVALCYIFGSQKEKLYAILRNNLSDIEQFVREIKAFLEAYIKDRSENPE